MGALVDDLRAPPLGGLNNVSELGGIHPLADSSAASIERLFRVNSDAATAGYPGCRAFPSVSFASRADLPR
jgi:hypothetical protein